MEISKVSSTTSFTRVLALVLRILKDFACFLSVERGGVDSSTALYRNQIIHLILYPCSKRVDSISLIYETDLKDQCWRHSFTVVEGKNKQIQMHAESVKQNRGKVIPEFVSFDLPPLDNWSVSNNLSFGWSPFWSFDNVFQTSVREFPTVFP